MSTHIALRCSDANAWSRCTLKPFLMQAITDKGYQIFEVTDAMQKGTDIHHYLEQDTPIEQVPIEYHHAVKQIRRFKQAFIQKILHNKIDDSFKELKVSLHQETMDDYDLIIQGTVDLVLFSESTKTLAIIDYKTGNFPVQAKGNQQLMLYAYGVLNRLSFKQFTQIDHIYLAIINQDEGINYAVYDTKDIIDNFNRVIDDVTNDPTFFVSELTCLWCKGKEFCKAYQNELNRKGD